MVSVIIQSMKKVLLVLLCFLSTLAQAAQPIKVVYIGDSLSLDAFGTHTYTQLVELYGKDQVAFYSSCGSSPQSWLDGYRIYTCHCGYKERTPKGNVNAKVHQTPKLSAIFQLYKPEILIVQQGTNWMDEFSSVSAQRAADKIAKLGPKIIWIAPPDHSAYSNATKIKVADLIIATGKTFKFSIINSRLYTDYTRGVTGPDGVHYGSKASLAWALNVWPELQKDLK